MWHPLYEATDGGHSTQTFHQILAVKTDAFQELKVKQMTLFGALGRLPESPPAGYINALVGDFFLTLVRGETLRISILFYSLAGQVVGSRVSVLASTQDTRKDCSE